MGGRERSAREECDSVARYPRTEQSSFGACPFDAVSRDCSSSGYPRPEPHSSHASPAVFLTRLWGFGLRLWISTISPRRDRHRTRHSSETLSRRPFRSSDTRARDRCSAQAAHDWDQPSLSSSTWSASWRFNAGPGSTQSAMRARCRVSAGPPYQLAAQAIIPARKEPFAIAGRCGPASGYPELYRRERNPHRETLAENDDQFWDTAKQDYIAPAIAAQGSACD